MTTTNTDRIHAAEVELAEATAEVTRLQAKLRAERDAAEARGDSAEDDRPRRLTAAEGKAEAIRRYPKANRDGTAPGTATAASTPDGGTPTAGTSADAGREEARRRLALRSA